MILPKFPLRTESGLMIVNVRFDMGSVCPSARIWAADYSGVGEAVVGCRFSVVKGRERRTDNRQLLRRDNRRDPCRFQLRANARRLFAGFERADADEVERRVIDRRILAD